MKWIIYATPLEGDDEPAFAVTRDAVVISPDLSQAFVYEIDYRAVSAIAKTRLEEDGDYFYGVMPALSPANLAQCAKETK